MMQKLPALPATFLEAQALAFARDWIEHHRKPNGVFHPNAAAIYGRSLMKEYAQLHPFYADEIVYFAENGSKEAALALKDLIAERIDRGEQLGAVLGAYNIKVLNPARGRPGPGGPAETFIRDFGIMLLMQALIDRFELPTNRGTDSNRLSHSSIAAQALRDAKIGILMDFKNIQKIWRRYLPAFAGTRYAARSCFASGVPVGCKGLFD